MGIDFTDEIQKMRTLGLEGIELMAKIAQAKQNRVIEYEREVMGLILDFENQAESKLKRGDDWHDGYADCCRLVVHRLQEILDRVKGAVPC